MMAIWRPGVVEVVKEVLGNARDHYTSADIATSSGDYKYFHYMRIAKHIFTNFLG